MSKQTSCELGSRPATCPPSRSAHSSSSASATSLSASPRSRPTDPRIASAAHYRESRLPTQPRSATSDARPEDDTGDTINPWTPSRCSTSTRSRAPASATASNGCGSSGPPSLSDRFDPEGSDIDFLVDFAPGNTNLFHAYFDLKFELERITGRPVDLVDASAVRNPYFKASAFGSAQELYAT